jgi:hypothetical protein
MIIFGGELHLMQQAVLCGGFLEGKNQFDSSVVLKRRNTTLD